LARDLLKKDGVILVSIDDGEVHHLRLLLDSVFRAENFIGSFVWQGGRKNDARLISLGHDYVLVYARQYALLREKDTRWRERKTGLEPIYEKVSELRGEHGDDFDAIHVALLRWYRELPDEHPSKAHDHFNVVDQRGVYFPDNLRSPNPRPNLVFEWKGYQPHPNGWAYGREKMAFWSSFRTSRDLAIVGLLLLQ
jgi:adenine-specific DNA-methyltransferase